MPAPGPLSDAKIAVLKDPAFRKRFTEPHLQSYFPSIDQCLATVGPQCRRLPWLYNILVGEITKTKEGWEWFKKQYPRIEIESPKPEPKPEKREAPKGVKTLSRRNHALEKGQETKQSQRREEVEELHRGPAVQRAIKTLKSYGRRK